LDATCRVELAEQGDGVGTMEAGGQDEQSKRAPEDAPTGQGLVGDREIPFLEPRDRRPAVNEAGPFFSYS
jgi:hypothetical protein